MISNKHLKRNTLISISTKTLNLFLATRLVYWIGFGILIAGLLLGVIQTGGGEQARTLIARSVKIGDGTTNFLLADMSNYFLPIIFLSLFVSVIALAIIGRKVVKLLPENDKPGEEFTRFRFTFVIMASSLIAPPLAFGSLLLL